MDGLMRALDENEVPNTPANCDKKFEKLEQQVGKKHTMCQYTEEVNGVCRFLFICLLIKLKEFSFCSSYQIEAQ